MSSNNITATVRDQVGKANRRLAAEGKVPAVLYGAGRDPLPLALIRHDIELFMSHHAAGAIIVELEIEGQKAPVSAMIRDVQHSAVKGSLLHVDFLEVSVNQMLHADVSLNFINDPAGVRLGGVLSIVMHAASIEAIPANLPESIDVDIQALEIGDALYARDIVMPKGVTLLADPDAIVVSVQAPRAEEEVVAETEVGVQPEVIGAKAEPKE